MPDFNFELPDGRTVTIEADDQTAALSAVRHFLATGQPSSTVPLPRPRPNVYDQFDSPLGKFRRQFPQYNDMSDEALANVMHQRFYADIPRDEFNRRIGLNLLKAGKPWERDWAVPEGYTLDEPSTMDDLGKLAPDLPYHAAASTFGIPGDIANLVGLGGMKYSPPTSKDWRERFQMEQYGRGTAPLYEPQTSAGKYAKAVAENAIGAVMPGGLAARAASVAIPAIASEAAGQATEGTEYETPARVGAALVGGLGVGMRTGGKQAAATAKTLQQQLTPTAAETKAAADAGYDAVRAMDFEVAPQAVQMLATQISNDLTRRGLTPRNASGAFDALGAASAAPAGARVTGTNIMNLRSELGEMAQEVTGTPARATANAKAATQARQALDSWLDSLPANAVVRGDAGAFKNALREADRNYSAALLGKDIGSRLNKAELRAAAANSGMNLENALRTQFRQILENPKLQRGYTQTELDSMRSLVEGGARANWRRFLGNVGAGGGGIGIPITAGGFGTLATMIGGPALGTAAAIAAPVIGRVSKSAGNRATLKAARQIEKDVLARSPLGVTRQQTIQPQLALAQKVIKRSKLAAAQKAALLQALQIEALPAPNMFAEFVPDPNAEPQIPARLRP